MCQGFYNANMEIQVIDNYLSEDKFRPIYDHFMGSEPEWHWIEGVVTFKDGYNQFVNIIYERYHSNNKSFEYLWSILEKEKAVALNRIKANLSVRTPELIVYDHGFHCDVRGDESQVSRIITGILYINTNNGYTLFENGEKVESVRNRFVRFPCNMKHTGTTCTDQDKRILINFNYV
tara:strand:- start:43 stop:573 length:531 start_codon:yes stop_codon:yes gene_type:complete